MRSTADCETPNNRATCRNVRLTHHYAATINTRSFNGSRQRLPH